MSTPIVPLEGIVVPAPVSELFLMDCGGYEYWHYVKEEIDTHAPVHTDLPVKTQASDKVFGLPFTIISVEVLTSKHVVFTATYGEVTLYCNYLLDPHGGQFSTDKYSFSFANR